MWGQREIFVQGHSKGYITDGNPGERPLESVDKASNMDFFPDHDRRRNPYKVYQLNGVDANLASILPAGYSIIHFTFKNFVDADGTTKKVVIAAAKDINTPSSRLRLYASSDYQATSSYGNYRGATTGWVNTWTEITHVIEGQIVAHSAPSAYINNITVDSDENKAADYFNGFFLYFSGDGGNTWDFGGVVVDYANDHANSEDDFVIMITEGASGDIANGDDVRIVRFPVLQDNFTVWDNIDAVTFEDTANVVKIGCGHNSRAMWFGFIQARTYMGTKGAIILGGYTYNLDWNGFWFTWDQPIIPNIDKWLGYRPAKLTGRAETPGSRTKIAISTTEGYDIPELNIHLNIKVSVCTTDIDPYSVIWGLTLTFDGYQEVFIRKILGNKSLYEYLLVGTPTVDDVVTILDFEYRLKFNFERRITQANQYFWRQNYDYIPRLAVTTIDDTDTATKLEVTTSEDHKMIVGENVDIWDSGITYLKFVSTAVSNILQNNPARVTVASSAAFTTGQTVSISGITDGMVEINGIDSVITVINGTTIDLDDIDSTLFTAWSILDIGSTFLTRTDELEVDGNYNITDIVTVKKFKVAKNTVGYTGGGAAAGGCRTWSTEREFIPVEIDDQDVSLLDDQFLGNLNIDNDTQSAFYVNADTRLILNNYDQKVGSEFSNNDHFTGDNLNSILNAYYGAAIWVKALWYFTINLIVVALNLSSDTPKKSPRSVVKGEETHGFGKAAFTNIQSGFTNTNSIYSAERVRTIFKGEAITAAARLSDSEFIVFTAGSNKIVEIRDENTASLNYKWTDEDTGTSNPKGVVVATSLEDDPMVSGRKEFLGVFFNNESSIYAIVNNRRIDLLTGKWSREYLALSAAVKNAAVGGYFPQTKEIWYALNGRIMIYNIIMDMWRPYDFVDQPKFILPDDTGSILFSDGTKIYTMEPEGTSAYLDKGSGTIRFYIEKILNHPGLNTAKLVDSVILYYTLDAVESLGEPLGTTINLKIYKQSGSTLIDDKNLSLTRLKNKRGYTTLSRKQLDYFRLRLDTDLLAISTQAANFKYFKLHGINVTVMTTGTQIIKK